MLEVPMLEKLAAIEAKYSQIEARLAAPETYDDPAAVARLNKEQNELSPVVETYRSYLAARERLAQAEELLSDPEMRELAQEELLQTNAELERLEGQLQLLLLPKDPNDNKNVIVEIRAGVGGEEAALFAHSLYRMYSMYAERSRWKTEVDSLSETELGGIKEISFTIEGEGAWSRLKFESGVHRVQRVPETESGGRVHTSTATVAVLPEMETVDVQLNPADVEMQVFRASGAGEQDLLRGASDPPANGYGGGVPAGAQPVPEPGQGHAPSGLPPVRGGAGEGGGGVHRPAPQTGGHRDAERADPDL
jgi:peptide chain release factor 1